jgi:hypothetical protein
MARLRQKPDKGASPSGMAMEGQQQTARQAFSATALNVSFNGSAIVSKLLLWSLG